MSLPADEIVNGLIVIEKKLTTISQAIIVVTALWPAMWSAAAAAAAAADAATSQVQLSLPVVAVVDRYPPYADFCRRHPSECDLSGVSVVPHSTDLMDGIRAINSTVNLEIQFALDISQYGAEEYWALPASGYGDCEDLALEKRSRLVASGVAPGALRLAFVFHRRLLNSHCVLTVETSEGTYILDSRTDGVTRWDRAPYNFETRERTDGLWDRFDQTNWRYDH